MRRRTILAVTIISLLAISTCDAQCNRGSRGRSAAGSISPLTPYNPTTASATPSFLAARYQAEQDQLNQQYLTAQNQRQGNRSTQTNGSEYGSSCDGNCPKSARRDKARQNNAEKALKLADSAAANERRSTAAKNYRRVIRILGGNHSLSHRALDALDEMEEGNGVNRSYTALLATTKK